MINVNDNNYLDVVRFLVKDNRMKQRGTATGRYSSYAYRARDVAVLDDIEGIVGGDYFEE
ncbi:hypothetical protein [Thermoactinomyces vulgaris]|uniref:hypothetical protein n=1 Tax=Thermoactinomyces vulgaris TaxID=2026 RepID=UPI003639E8DD